MNSTVGYRRRIERYAQLIDEANGSGRHHLRSPIDNDLAEYVAIGTRLTTAAPHVVVRDEFRLSCRARVMAAAEQARLEASTEAVPASVVGRATVGTVRESVAPIRLLPKQRSPVKSGRVRARGAILAGLAIGTLALSGISAASSDAMPDSPLYGMKLSQENTQLAFTSSAVGKGHLYLGFARTRLSEAKAIQTDTHLLAGVLGTMDHQTQLGVKLLLTDTVNRHNVASLQAVDQFVASQRLGIDSLLGNLSGPASARMQISIKLLDKVAHQADTIRSALSCTSIVVEGTNELGPLPATSCSTLPNPTGSPIKPATGHHVAPQITTAGATSTGISDAAPMSSGSTSPSSVTPRPVATDDGGLLGDLRRILGGLIGD